MEIKNLKGEVILKLKTANLHDANLNGADLNGADLRGANLYDANLHGANLRGANLHGANLHGANLPGANLPGADLYDADLYDANLHGANLHGANLNGADLRGANLYDANLHGANLHGANLRGAKNIKAIFQTSLSILKNQKGKLIAYKYLKKDYQSPYQYYQYEIGKTYNFKANTDIRILCSEGCNVATLEWCLRETQANITDYVYVECEFNACDVVIPYNSDGKFRINGDVLLSRELTKEELQEATKNIV